MRKLIFLLTLTFFVQSVYCQDQLNTKEQADKNKNKIVELQKKLDNLSNNVKADTIIKYVNNDLVTLKRELDDIKVTQEIILKEIRQNNILLFQKFDSLFKVNRAQPIIDGKVSNSSNDYYVVIESQKTLDLANKALANMSNAKLVKNNISLNSYGEWYYLVLKESMSKSSVLSYLTNHLKQGNQMPWFIPVTQVVE